MIKHLKYKDVFRPVMQQVRRVPMQLPGQKSESRRNRACVVSKMQLQHGKLRRTTTLLAQNAADVTWWWYGIKLCADTTYCIDVPSSQTHIGVSTFSDTPALMSSGSEQ